MRSSIAKTSDGHSISQNGVESIGKNKVLAAGDVPNSPEWIGAMPKSLCSSLTLVTVAHSARADLYPRLG